MALDTGKEIVQRRFLILALQQHFARDHHGAARRLGIVVEAALLVVQQLVAEGLAGTRPDLFPVVAQELAHGVVPGFAAARTQAADQDGVGQAGFGSGLVQRPQARLHAPAPGTHRITDVDHFLAKRFGIVAGISRRRLLTGSGCGCGRADTGDRVAIGNLVQLLAGIGRGVRRALARHRVTVGNVVQFLAHASPFCTAGRARKASSTRSTLRNSSIPTSSAAW